MLIAMDRQSVRTFSKDGHLHVARSHISKANVCPYKGAEIPNGEALGLEPDRVYKLLRHPDELEKAAPTFRNLPLLCRHVPVTSAEHPHELVVGSTGSNIIWAAPYLDGDLSIWDDEAIAGVESDEQREISAAYHYIAEMTPGEYGGLRYDGIMRNIVGNHVALVPEGRAGSDVIVGDSKLETPVMAKRLKSRKALMVSGAVRSYLGPKLAADAQIDVNGILADITAKNWKASKPIIIAKLRSATAGKLAMDATLDDIVELVDALDDVTDGEVDDDAIVEAVEGETPAAEPLEEEDKAAAVDADGDKIAKLLEFLKGKLSDDDLAAAMELVGAASDDPDNGDPADTTPVGDGGGKPMKTGMDAAMVGKLVAAIRTAERAVEPLVGEVIAMDSASAIYRFALDKCGIDAKAIHHSALPALVAAEVRARANVGTSRATIAQDAAAEVGSFRTRFPDARIPKKV